MVCLLGSALLRKATVLRVAAGILASATSFFLISNFVVWAVNQVDYPHTFAGLGACYALALPFYMNDLLSTTITSGALFGLPVLAAKLVEAFLSSQNHTQPLAQAIEQIKQQERPRHRVAFPHSQQDHPTCHQLPPLTPSPN